MKSEHSLCFFTPQLLIELFTRGYLPKIRRGNGSVVIPACNLCKHPLPSQCHFWKNTFLFDFVSLKLQFPRTSQGHWGLSVLCWTIAMLTFICALHCWKIERVRKPPILSVPGNCGEAPPSSAWLILLSAPPPPTVCHHRSGRDPLHPHSVFHKWVVGSFFLPPSNLGKCLLIWLDQTLIRLPSCPPALAVRGVAGPAREHGTAERNICSADWSHCPPSLWSLSVWLRDSHVCGRSEDSPESRVSVPLWLAQPVLRKPPARKGRVVFIWLRGSVVVWYAGPHRWGIIMSEKKLNN